MVLDEPHRTLSHRGARARARGGGADSSTAGDPRPPCSPIWHRHRRVGRRVDRSCPSSDGLGSSEACGRRDGGSNRLKGCPGRRGAPDWPIANGRPPRRCLQRGANREDVLLSMSFIPSGPKQCVVLACKLPAIRPLPQVGVRKSLTRKESVRQRTLAKTPG
jgi:hypothetical protein